MARPAAAHRHPLQGKGGADLVPIGKPPARAPARVKRWWRKTVADWPQLSQRDGQALLDYCHLLVEQEDLREQVEREGRFLAGRDGPKEAPAYTALVRVGRRLQSLRRRAGEAGEPRAVRVGRRLQSLRRDFAAEPDLIDLHEAARLASVHRATVRRWIADGTTDFPRPVILSSQCHRYSRRAVIAWLDSRAT